MTLDEQLRGLARRADQQQAAITVHEVVQRATSRGNGSSVARSRSDGHPKVLNQVPASFNEEEATMIDLDNEREVSAPTSKRWSRRAVIAGLVAAAAVVAIALVAIRKDEPVNPADQPSPSSPTATTQPSAVVTAPPATAPATTPPQAMFGASDAVL